MRFTSHLYILGFVVLLANAFPVVEEAASNSSALRLLPRLGTGDGSSPDNAVDIEIGCVGQQDNCDQNAYAILCAGAPNVLQRGSSSSQTRRDSGAAYQPFAKSSDVQQEIGVSRPSAVDISAPYDSAEEFPYASSTQGGWGSFLFPTQRTQQLVQGGSLSAALRNVPSGGYYHIKQFRSCTRPYCVAYNVEPKNTDVCKKDNVDSSNGIDWTKFIFRRISLAGQSYKFQLVPQPGSLVKRDIDTLPSNVTIAEPLSQDENHNKQKRADFPSWVNKDSITCLSDSAMPNDGSFPLASSCLADFITAQSTVNGGLPVSNAFCNFGGSTMAMCSYSAPNYGGHDEVNDFNSLADSKCGTLKPAYLFIPDWNKTYWRSSTGMKDVCTNNGGSRINAGGPGAGSG